MHQQFQGFRPGDIVDERYEVMDEIGRGGFGVVYRARQIAIDRIVALKILLPEADTVDPLAVERFRREAVLISSLESPNTITLIEFGQTDNGSLYTVMEFARGDTLRDILAHEGKLDAKRTVRIVSQVCQSLHEAHLQGVVHRDLKPANIMVGEFAGQKDHVKVLDFGIAKILRSGDTQSTLALTGRIVGTPRYMAPEQLRGANPTPGADIYALGLIMYEMLTGQPAVKANDAMEQIEAQMIGASFKLPQLPGVPLALVSAVNKTLEKDLDRRYGSADQLRQDLENATRPGGAHVDPNATKVRAAVAMPSNAAHVYGSQQEPVEDDDEDEPASLGPFIIAAVILFLLALGGVAFLLVTEEKPGDQASAAEQADAGTVAEETTETTEEPRRLPPPISPDQAGTAVAAVDTTGDSAATGPGTEGTEDTPSDQTEASDDSSESSGGSASSERESRRERERAAERERERAAAREREAERERQAAAAAAAAAAAEQEEEEEEEEESTTSVIAVVGESTSSAQEEEEEEEQAAAATVEITVNADPRSADVYIEGDRICRSTPCTVRVPADGSSVSLRVRESGYDTHRANIDSGDGPTINVELEREEEEEETGPQIIAPL